VCTSYNGIAAVNVNGRTLCTLLQLQSKNVNVEQLRKDLKLENGISAMIIDEISTVTPNDFANISDRLSLATGRPGPFGGLPIIMVGDFMQLPPVFPPERFATRR